MRMGIADAERDFDWYYDQIMRLETMVSLQPFSNGLSGLVKHSQVETKKAGKTFSEIRSFLNGVNEILFKSQTMSSVFENIEDFFSKTFIAEMISNSLVLAEKLSSGLLFRTTPSVQLTADKIMSLVGKGNLNDAQAYRAIYKYIDAKIKSKFFKSYAEQNHINVPGLFFGSETMAKRLYRLKKEAVDGGLYHDLRNNLFLRIYSL